MNDEQVSLSAVYCIDGPLLEALKHYRALSDADSMRVTARMVALKHQRAAARRLQDERKDEP